MDSRIDNDTKELITKQKQAHRQRKQTQRIKRERESERYIGNLLLTGVCVCVCVCVSCLVVSDSLQARRLQPTRALCQLDSPGKNTGVGCHFLLLKKLETERKCSRSVVTDSLRPHGLQPTRLLHPSSFPGESTGVGCHFPLLINRQILVYLKQIASTQCITQVTIFNIIYNNL